MIQARDTLAWFDRLPPVPPGRMRGEWRGETSPSGHPLDGMLEACGWWGKRFDDDEHVHPLVFRTASGARISLRPTGARMAVALAMRAPWLRSPAAGRVVKAVLPLLATRRSQARLRRVEVRGVVSAAVCHDTVPIQDALRQVDADTVLGMMDMKGMAQPYFFLLRRLG